MLYHLVFKVLALPWTLSSPPGPRWMWAGGVGVAIRHIPHTCPSCPLDRVIHHTKSAFGGKPEFSLPHAPPSSFPSWYFEKRMILPFWQLRSCAQFSLVLPKMCILSVFVRKYQFQKLCFSAATLFYIFQSSV